MTLPEFPLRAYPESGLARRVSRVFSLHRKSEPACTLCPHCSGRGTGCAPSGRLERVIAGFREPGKTQSRIPEFPGAECADVIETLLVAR